MVNDVHFYCDEGGSGRDVLYVTLKIPEIKRIKIYGFLRLNADNY